MRLPEVKLLKVNWKLRGGHAGQESHPSATERRDVGSLHLSLQGRP